MKYKPWVIVSALVLAAVAGLEMHHYSGRVRSAIVAGADGGFSSPTLAVISPACPDEKFALTFQPKWQKINKNGNCAVDLYYDERDVVFYAIKAGTKKVIGPFGRGEAPLEDIEWIWSKTTFSGLVSLPPRRYTDETL